MKNFNELTEQEILNLTDTQLDNYLTLAKAENGVKLVILEEAPKLTVVPKPKHIGYYCNIFGTDLCFNKIEDLQKLVGLLDKLDSKFSIECDWDINLNYKRDSLKTKTYSLDINTINQIEYYTLEERNKYKDEFKTNKLLSTNYEKAVKEFNSNQAFAKDVVNEILDKHNRVINKYSKLKRLLDIYITSYLPLSDSETAINFMRVAYNLTDEEKQYILDNYLETIK